MWKVSAFRKSTACSGPPFLIFSLTDRCCWKRTEMNTARTCIYIPHLNPMLGRASITAVRSRNLGVRTMSGVSLPSLLYKNVWRKSTNLYLTYIAAGCIIFGSIYDSMTDTIWRTVNRGVSLNITSAVFVVINHDLCDLEIVRPGGLEQVELLR